MFEKQTVEFLNSVKNREINQKNLNENLKLLRLIDIIKKEVKNKKILIVGLGKIDTAHLKSFLSLKVTFFLVDTDLKNSQKLKITS